MSDDATSDPEILLALVDLHLQLGGKLVFDGLSLTVRRGETLALLGRSGAGKTLLLRAILGLTRPARGAVHFAGRDVLQVPRRELPDVRRRIGMVFQGSALFDSLTVGENVAYGLRQLPRAARPTEADLAARVAECLTLVDLPGSEARFPAELSGGMKKRVAIARAIAPRPEVLLYDEPTSGLDPATRRRVAGLIVTLADKLGVTSVVVTHDLALVRAVADRIVLLADGRIRGEGEPAVALFLAGVDEEEAEEEPWTHPRSSP